MITLSADVRALIDGPNFATVATLNPDGSPQTSIVWVGLDEDTLVSAPPRTGGRFATCGETHV
jgi:hypothetical protein